MDSSTLLLSFDLGTPRGSTPPYYFVFAEPSDGIRFWAKPTDVEPFQGKGISGGGSYYQAIGASTGAHVAQALLRIPREVWVRSERFIPH